MKRRQGRLRTALAAVLLAALFCAAIAEEAEVTVAEPVVESLPETSLEDLTPPASDEPGEIPAATEDDAIVLATEDDAALAPEGELPPEAAAENAVGAKKRGNPPCWRSLSFRKRPKVRRPRKRLRKRPKDRRTRKRLRNRPKDCLSRKRNRPRRASS